MVTLKYSGLRSFKTAKSISVTWEACKVWKVKRRVEDPYIGTTEVCSLTTAIILDCLISLEEVVISVDHRVLVHSSLHFCPKGDQLIKEPLLKVQRRFTDGNNKLWQMAGLQSWWGIDIE